MQSFHKQPSVMSVQSSERQSDQQAPIAGFRIPASGSSTLSSFPLLQMCGPAFADTSGHPIYVVSAILGTSVHPGKAGPHLYPAVRISLGGFEVHHDGRFDLLPITSEMTWVAATKGELPEGHHPVQGGYEKSGQQLFHALARLKGCWVPGKTGRHLGGANFPFDCTEVILTEGYRVLCWKPGKTVGRSKSG